MAPAPKQLSVMSDLASRILPIGLALNGRERPGKTARLVLTGDGGGDWLIPLGEGDAAPNTGMPATGRKVPDVTVTADVVDWCRLVGDRVAPSELIYAYEGDAAIASDLVTAAPALATL